MRNLIAGAVTMIAAASGNAGWANETVEGHAHISATVPVVCSIEADSFSLDMESGAVVGTIFEFCNSGRGYQVIANHRPLSAGEFVEVRYGRDRAQLQRSGISPISLLPEARLRSQQVIIETGHLDARLNLSFSLTAV